MIETILWIVGIYAAIGTLYALYVGFREGWYVGGWFIDGLVVYPLLVAFWWFWIYRGIEERYDRRRYR